MKTLSRTYLIALSIIALVIGFSQYLVQRSISTGSSDSRTINIAGRQRMLSQKISKAALALQVAASPDEFENRKAELEAAYTLWITSHEALQHGNKEMDMEEVNNSPKILLFFHEATPHYEVIKTSVAGILASEEIADTRTPAFSTNLQNILVHEGKFLKLMNDITFEYDAESTSRTRSLSNTEYVLFAIAIVLLIMEGMFIFKPAIRKIQQYTEELITQGEILKQALAKEEYLNNQARSIFANVKQGVFLLDKNLMINEFHSQETENIFNTGNLENTNFLKLMRPRLIKRDLMALEMFVEHLFNKEIRETVVNRLNPVEQVEIFPEKGTAENLEPRHIRISFARIYNEGEIHRVLVTVLDETENILMRRQIEESEERNREESTQLLAILKVEPTALHDFLNHSIESLNSISNEYESRKNDDFKELISYTFNTIHRVKGNATLINLDIIVNKLHVIEDSIVTLKGQLNVEGKNFLRIVYQISDVISILNNMYDMQAKIASVYDHTKYQLPAEISAAEQLKNALETGLQKMSMDNDKKVVLDFNDSGTALPAAYQVTIKDIAVQLIRNSLAHGIEAAVERSASGKPDTATIKISLARTADNHIAFTYADDGRGLDIEKILSKAVKDKLIEREEISQLTSEDITSLIFRNDFSTTDQVNPLSGRGQGLGLVKSIINKHNGSYKLGFERGKYFRMEINLPVQKELQPLDKTA